MPLDTNGTRQAIFLELVESGARKTPSELGDEIGQRRQNVKYHLDQLVERGLVVHDEEGYRAQPVFTDDEIEERFVEMLQNLVPEVSERVILDDDVAPEGQPTVVFNCIRMYVALELLEPPAAGEEDASEGSGAD